MGVERLFLLGIAISIIMFITILVKQETVSVIHLQRVAEKILCSAFTEQLNR
ncbi:hypothetical protein GCM10011502_21750 [Oceanisphaera marina]|uniref:Uncharacterized protein n=1 Tax=Oceanisphaera marina TaxID=2017550 RepID=A0ABQ1IN79_9GAMM|nr:hypothetical protein GCM10011502_21750 [Oceanisphaera marina]